MKKTKKTSGAEWALVKTSRHTRYYVNRQGLCRVDNDSTGETRVFGGYYNKYTGYVHFADGLLHRLVAKAFLPNPGRREQVHHLNSDPRDNRLENLAWVTRRQNNGTQEANDKRRKALSGRRFRTGMRILATSPAGETRAFASGYECAAFLGCSHALVYNCLNGKVSAKRARGWTLRREAAAGSRK